MWPSPIRLGRGEVDWRPTFLSSAQCHMSGPAFPLCCPGPAYHSVVTGAPPGLRAALISCHLHVILLYHVICMFGRQMASALRTLPLQSDARALLFEDAPPLGAEDPVKASKYSGSVSPDLRTTLPRRQIASGYKRLHPQLKSDQDGSPELSGWLPDRKTGGTLNAPRTLQKVSPLRDLQEGGDYAYARETPPVLIHPFIYSFNLCVRPNSFLSVRTCLPVCPPICLRSFLFSFFFASLFFLSSLFLSFLLPSLFPLLPSFLFLVPSFSSSFRPNPSLSSYLFLLSSFSFLLSSCLYLFSSSTFLPSFRLSFLLPSAFLSFFFFFLGRKLANCLRNCVFAARVFEFLRFPQLFFSGKA